MFVLNLSSTSTSSGIDILLIQYFLVPSYHSIIVKNIFNLSKHYNF